VQEEFSKVREHKVVHRRQALMCGKVVTSDAVRRTQASDVPQPELPGRKGTVSSASCPAAAGLISS
jgi:hypothetical protein